MFLGSSQIEFLRLCAMARYLSCDSAGKYDLLSCRDRVSKQLLATGHIKLVNGGCKCFRLTRRGRNLLYDFDYEYSDDLRPHKTGSTFERRIHHGDICLMMHCAGIDIFAETLQGVDRADNTYIPSLTIRGQVKSKVVAGTRFYGILRVKDTAYVVYYADGNNDGIFPGYEEQTFINLISGLRTVRHKKILLVNETLEGLMSAVFTNEQKELKSGLISYSEIMERWSYDVHVLPLNMDGVTGLRVIGNENIQERIATRFGEKRPNMKFFDAVADGYGYIIGLDMNISRVKMALAYAMNCNLTPHIIGLPYQCDIYEALAKKINYPNEIEFSALNIIKFREQFPELKTIEKKPTPVTLKNGEYVELWEKE